MTVTDLALEAAAWTLEPGSDTLAGLTASQRRGIAIALTATLQEIHDIAPSIFRRRIGARLAAPVTATVTATNGSDTVTTSYPFPEGCTVQIGGIFNEIRTENGVKKLLVPFSGATGDQSATFYDDCLILDATVETVVGPVVLNGKRKLEKKNYRTDQGGPRYYPDYGRWIGGGGGQITVGPPSLYWIEPFLLESTTGQVSTHRLRISPLPNQPCDVTYDVTIKAPIFTEADLGTDSVPSTKSLAVPNGSVESLVRPLFIREWSGMQWCRPEPAQMQRISENYQKARAALQDYRMQQECNRYISPPL